MNPVFPSGVSRPIEPPLASTGEHPGTVRAGSRRMAQEAFCRCLLGMGRGADQLRCAFVDRSPIGESAAGNGPPSGRCGRGRPARPPSPSTRAKALQRTA